MNNVLKFGRRVGVGSVIRLGGMGFYSITRVEGRRLFGIQVLHPDFPVVRGVAVYICEDYLKTHELTYLGKPVIIQIVHSDGTPVR